MADADALAKASNITRTKLLGVELPKTLDLTSKSLYNDYMRFKVLAKSCIECYTGFDEKEKTKMVLRWMGTDCMLKHEENSWADEDKFKLESLWKFFDKLCLKTEGTCSSYNAARVKLKFLRQEKGETVHQFYSRIRALVADCEFKDDEKVMWEAATLKYGLCDHKVIEKVYELDKDATTAQILQTAHTTEVSQMHIRAVQKIQQEYQTPSTTATISEFSKGQSSQRGKGNSRGRGVGRGKDQRRTQKPQQPGSCRVCKKSHKYGECEYICSYCKRPGHLTEDCWTKAKDVLSKRPANKKTGYKKSFQGNHQRQIRHTHETHVEYADCEEEDSDGSVYESNEITIDEVYIDEPDNSGDQLNLQPVYTSTDIEQVYDIFPMLQSHKSVLVPEYQWESHDADACLSSSLDLGASVSVRSCLSNGSFLQPSLYAEAVIQDEAEDVFDVEETTVYGKKLPKHVTVVNFNEVTDQDTVFGVVQVENQDGQLIRLKGKLDTGAQINIMNKSTAAKIFGENYQKFLKSSKVKLRGYGNKPFKNLGVLSCTVKHRNVTGINVQFYVTEIGSNLLSLTLCLKMKLVKILCEPDNCDLCHGEYDVAESTSKSDCLLIGPAIQNPEDLISQYPDVFEGLGCLKNFQVKLEIDPSIPPVHAPARHYVDHIAKGMKVTTDQMQKDDVIYHFQGYTEWCCPAHPVVKPSNEVRVTMDLRDLNKAILSPKHYTETLEEILGSN